MIYILYSNDYEVFLGGNHVTEREVLVETSKKVLSACEEVDIPMTLFCVLACLWRYRELGYSEFPIAVEQQLKEALTHGHDVQAHIHPHWFETNITFNESGASKYDFELSKFLLGNWTPENGSELKEFCTDLFSRSKQYLENLLQAIDPTYECLAYRAGGYGIQPNIKQIFSALIESRYTIDSSVVPGMVLDSNVNHIDFTEVPEQGNYFIAPDSGLKQASAEGIFEIPVLALRQGQARWILAKSFLRKLVKHLTKSKPHRHLGFPIQLEEPKQKPHSVLKQLIDELKLVKRGWYMLELGTDAELMLEATKKYIDYHLRDDDLYFSVSCHSKSTYPELLDAMKNYHHSLKSIYGDQLKAITYGEAQAIMKAKEKDTK